MDPMPEVPTLLYIGRRGRVIEGAIRLRDYVPSLLHNMCNKLVLSSRYTRLGLP
jgi:hypothetical protein